MIMIMTINDNVLINILVILLIMCNGNGSNRIKW